MQKQKFNPNEPYSVSLSFGPHIVHGHAEESAFGQVMQNMLLRELKRACKESFDIAVCAGAAASPVVEFESKDADFNSIRESLAQWQQLISEQPPLPEFTPCSVPYWMRPGLRAKGMTDAEIASILITGIEPSRDGTPGVIFRTVSL